MNVIILAAGYATRLYPLTRNQPKPLLLIQGKPIIDFIIDHLDSFKVIDRIYVVSNAVFVEHFEKWAQQKDCRHPITIVNDETATIETRLGAIRDIGFVVDSCGVDSDVLVIAGDNLFDDDLVGLVQLGQSRNEGVIAVYPFEDKTQLKMYGVVTTDAHGKIISFVEKSKQPPSSLVATCIYYFPRSVLDNLRVYIERGQNLDAPGNFIDWLVLQENIWTYSLKGKWYDIGSKESYAAVQNME